MGKGVWLHLSLESTENLWGGEHYSRSTQTIFWWKSPISHIKKELTNKQNLKKIPKEDKAEMF